MNLHHLTPRPPLGWNSYDSFGCFINEARALENLRVFVARLKPHGYDYFVIDAGWYRQFDLGGREFPGKDDNLREPLRLVLPPDEVLFVRYN
jgi:hypothetical protein